MGARAPRSTRHPGPPADVRRDPAPLDRHLPRHRAHEYHRHRAVKFENSWNGLLYVPAGMPDPDRDSDLRIGPEMLPRWWYYDTD
ncbi:hypothetical protein [Mycolicibacterium setense]